MNSDEIKNLYDRLMSKDYGCDYYKMDLHIHTPASKCYKQIQKNRIAEYEKILSECKDNDIRIIAITDHNSVRGYYELMNIIKDNEVRFSKYKNILILPGIEISCFGKHILTIFPSETREDKLNTFLYTIGIDTDEQGNEDADAYRVTPLELMRRTFEMGGISVLAHADASNGMLEKLLRKKSTDKEDWIHKGKSLASIVKSEFLHGISLVDRKLEPYLIKDILRNEAYRRNRPTAILYCSDSHGTRDAEDKYIADGKPIGSHFSYIKLSELSFHGLYISLLDPDVRIQSGMPNNDSPYIEGVAIKGGFLGADNRGEEYQLFRFNKALNCAIGARGTGKSTLLDTIQYTINTFDKDANIAVKFDSAIVFIKYNDETYAFLRNTRTEKDDYTEDLVDISKNSTIYRRSKIGSFYSNEKLKEMQKELVNFSLVAYRQREINDFSQKPDGPRNIIDNLILISRKDEYKELISEISQKKEAIEVALDSVGSQEWDDLLKSEVVEEEDITDICKPFEEVQDLMNDLYLLRTEVVNQVNSILAGQVRLSISKKFSNENKKNLIDGILIECRRKRNLPYEKEIDIRAWLKYIIEETEKNNLKWMIPNLLLSNDPDKLGEQLVCDVKITKIVFGIIRPALKKWIFEIFPEDYIELEYNVNTGISKSDRFLPRYKLSLGQKSVAMLLIVVTAAHELGDSRPLIIDQPEDDLDNIYIYSSLVREFRKVKNRRQLIFATHNPNIPIAGDAENIIILTSLGKLGRIDSTGSIDKVGISEKVLNILEGGKEALLLRTSKYPNLE